MKKALFTVLAFAMFASIGSSTNPQVTPGPYPDCYPGDTCIASITVPGPYPDCYPGDTCVVGNSAASPNSTAVNS